MIALWDENHETKKLLQIYFCLHSASCTSKMDLLVWQAVECSVCVGCVACPASHPLATRCTLLQPLYHSLLYSPFCSGACCWQMRCGQAEQFPHFAFLSPSYFGFSLRRSNNLTPNVLPLLAHNQTQHNCAHTWRRTRTHTQALYPIDK